MIVFSELEERGEIYQRESGFINLKKKKLN